MESEVCRPGKVTSFPAREMGQPLAGITTPACSGGLHIRNHFSFAPGPRWWVCCHTQPSDESRWQSGGPGVQSPALSQLVASENRLGHPHE